MEALEAKEILRQKVREALGEFKVGNVDVDATTTYLLDLIEAGDPAQYEHWIPLRAHD